MPNDPTDADLVRAAQGGDTVSLGLLLERYRATLYSQALQIVGHGARAEDAVHDAFIIALRRIDQVREPAAVGGWLRAIVRNVCLMQVRAARGELSLDALPEGYERAAPTGNAADAIDRLALREWVWAALGELPEALRATAMLRYFGSYQSYEAIAATLDVPVGTVRSRLNQVKRKLADALLETTGLAHPQMRESTARYAGIYAEIGRAYNSNTISRACVDGFATDLVGVFSDGRGFQGRDSFVDVLRGDADAGMKLHITSFLASEGLTVLEGNWEGPPDDPLHCPPAMTQVCFWRGDQIQRVHLYYAPREEGAGEAPGTAPSGATA
ncbi:MAG TPA: sigma-70 family RNA polymerase sigma factor [Thermomicrobiales bacterium]|jgi:RNA polymerase sigma-70 factor (ECF subfamily)